MSGQEHERPLVDLYADTRLSTAVRDVVNCRRVLREQGEPHTWIDALVLHRVRVEAHTLMHVLGMRK